MATREAIQRGADQSVMPQVFRKAQDFEVAFVRAGGLLAAGVDPTGNGGALPGFGDQRNHELLVEAGKLADLVVIRGDPSTNPAEIRNVVTVFKDGIGYDAGRLIDAVKGVVGIR